MSELIMFDHRMSLQKKLCNGHVDVELDRLQDRVKLSTKCCNITSQTLISFNPLCTFDSVSVAPSPDQL